MSAKRKFIMGVAGGSGSGKTTFARAVLEQSRAAGITGQMFSLDNYYRPLGHLSLKERRSYNFDHPHAIDFDLALEQLRSLREGSAIDQPVYDFKVHTRKAKPRRLEPTQIIIVEGLYAPSTTTRSSSRRASPPPPCAASRATSPSAAATWKGPSTRS